MSCGAAETISNASIHHHHAADSTYGPFLIPLHTSGVITQHQSLIYPARSGLAKAQQGHPRNRWHSGCSPTASSPAVKPPAHRCSTSQSGVGDHRSDSGPPDLPGISSFTRRADRSSAPVIKGAPVCDRLHIELSQVFKALVYVSGFSRV